MCTIKIQYICIKDSNLNIYSAISNWEQAAVVRTDQGNSEGIEIRKGTRHGCVLSLYLFNIFTELVFSVIESANEGVSVAGRIISNLRYADDTSITVENENKLKNTGRTGKSRGQGF